MRKLALVFLAFVVPLALFACNDRPVSPGITQAQADLHKAEQNLVLVVSALIQAEQSGLLQGDALMKAKIGVREAHGMVKEARVAVDAGNATAVNLASRALSRVLALVVMYVPKEK